MRVRRQGDWERGTLLTTRGGRHEGDKVRLCSRSPEEPEGETERLKPEYIDKRQFVPFATTANDWADENTVWREGEMTGYHQRSALVRLRMGWEKEGWDGGYLVQEGLDVRAILQQTPTREARGTRNLEPGDVGLGRGSEVLSAVQELPSLHVVQRWENRQAEEGGSRAQAFSGGSKKISRGTYGWLATVRGETYTGGGLCNPCWGGLDSYRTETYGVLSVLVALHSIVLGGLTIWCDNSSVVRVVERLQKGGNLPKRCADLWYEVQEWLKRWGSRVEVRWARGHAEKRKKKEEWTDLDWGNYLADAIAELMYIEASDALDMAPKLPCTGHWRLWDNGEPASDKLCDMTLQRLSENHLDNYMSRHGMGILSRDTWEYTAAGLGYTGSHAPHLRGMNVQRLFSKNRTQEELRHQGSCGGKSEAVKAAMAQEHWALCNHKKTRGTP